MYCIAGVFHDGPRPLRRTTPVMQDDPIDEQASSTVCVGLTVSAKYFQTSCCSWASLLSHLFR